MKKIIKKLKESIKFIIGIVIGITVCRLSVYAYTFYANEIPYKKNNQSTVAGALDTLFTRTTSYAINKEMVCPGCVFRYSKDSRYNINSSARGGTRSLQSNEYKTNYEDISNGYFLGHVLDSNGRILSTYVCGLEPGLYCIRGVDKSQSSLTYKPFYQEAANKLKLYFPSCNINTSNSKIECTGNYDRKITVYSDGKVTISSTRNSRLYCTVSEKGNSICNI